MKVRTKIFLTFIFTIFSILTITAYSFLLYSSKVFKSELENNLITLSELTKNEIERNMKNSQEKFDIIVNKNRLKKYFKILKSINKSKKESILEFLNTIVKEENNIEEISLLDVNKNIVFSTGKNLENKKFSLIDINNKNVSYLYNIYSEKNNILKSIFISKVILNNRIVGYIIIKNNFDRLIEIINSNEHFRNSSKILLFKSNIDNKINFLSNKKIDFKKNEVEKFIRKIIKRQKNIQELKDYKGKSVIVAYNKLKNSNWGIIIKLDKNVLHAPIKNMTKIIIIIISLGLVLSIFASMLINYFVLNPITKLEKITKKITEDNKYYKLEFNSNDEIGSLAKSFNNMIEKIEKNNEIILDNSKKLEQEVNSHIESKKKIENEKDKALKASKAKTIFLANMSHEIRNPLSSIIGLIGLLEKDYQDIIDFRFIKLLKSSSESLLTLINDILDMSKIECGGIELKSEDFDFRKFFIDAIDPYIFTAQTKNLELNYSIDEKIPQLLNGDKNKLKQILLNLIGNAIKFTRKGEIFILVQENRKSKGNIQLSFTVSDTGKGIPEDKLEEIFEEFKQVENENGVKTIGTGLGLSISKKLVETMGGFITCESELGKGTIFNFTINMKIAANEIIDMSNEEEENRNQNNFNILLAEDNYVNLETLSSLLENKGFNILKTENGKEAFEAFVNNDIDIVLSDLEMPMLNGYELAKKIRENDKKIPIIAISGFALPELIDKCYKHGFSEFLSKPVRLKTLYKTVEKHIYNLKK